MGRTLTICFTFEAESFFLAKVAALLLLLVCCFKRSPHAPRLGRGLAADEVWPGREPVLDGVTLFAAITSKGEGNDDFGWL